MPTDPSDRISDSAKFVCTKIINDRLMFRCGRRTRVDRLQNRAQAILDIQIGLALSTVTQNSEMIRMFQKLLIEVEDMTVRVPLAQDRDEAKNVTLESKTLAVGLDHAF